jgi:hypothetical protein
MDNVEFIRELSEEEINKLDNRPLISYWEPVYQGDEISNYRCYKCQIANTFGKSPARFHYCYNCGCEMLNCNGVKGFDILGEPKCKFPHTVYNII